MNRPVDKQDWLQALAEKVETDGPQSLAVEGHAALMILTEAQFRLLSERKPTFKDWLLTGPRFDDVEIERDPRPSRDVSL